MMGHQEVKYLVGDLGQIPVSSAELPDVAQCRRIVDPYVDHFVAKRDWGTLEEEKNSH